MEEVRKWSKGRRKNGILKKQRREGRGRRNKLSLILFSSLLPQIIFSIDDCFNHILASLRTNVSRKYPSNSGIRRHLLREFHQIFCLEQWFSTGVDFCPQRHIWLVKGILSCHNWGGATGI